VAQEPRPLLPSQSPAHFFGAELRFWRERRGFSQDRLGAIVFVSGDTVSKVEKALRFPTRDLAVDCDAALETGGSLSRLWVLVEAHRASQLAHVDNAASDLESILSAGMMKLRVDEDGNMWAELNRRSFLVGSAGALLGQTPLDVATTVADGSVQTARHTMGSEDPFGFAEYAATNWPDLRLSRPVPDYGVDWNAMLPGGRSMLGSRTSLQLHAARIERGRALLSMPDRSRVTEFLRRPERSTLVGVADDGEQSRYYVLDGRYARNHLTHGASSHELPAPAAYELDDLTYGILWAVGNYDDALQADDQALEETRSDLRAYERLSASAVSREAAPGLNSVAHMWLGSEFCARHILKGLAELPVLPSFWTREQRGEEASAWLLFDHKYPYLRSTTETLGGSATTRAFCLPEHVVRASPRYERILLFLAVALMESLGIQAKVTTDPAHEEVEGFVIAPNHEAIIANWVRSDGVWHVDVTGRSSTVREFTAVADDVGAHSEIDSPTAAGRLRALAHYLDLPWSWLVGRCGEFGRYGTSGLIESRSRLVSATGLDAACTYVGALPADS
jgi:transcriptional regulator with XRE-family HTH domain